MRTIKILDKNFISNTKTNSSSVNQILTYFQWDRSDIQDSDELVFYTDFVLTKVNPNVKTKVAWLLEPRILIGGIYKWIKRNRKKFDYIITHDKWLLDHNKNFVFAPVGNCWMFKEDQKIYLKNKLFSIIASKKIQTKGQRLRHLIVREFGEKYNIDLYGHGYKSIEYKLEGLKDYMFSFSIENSRTDYYFTEKLIDCFRTGTVPIYWGSPSIGKFFDLEGMIVFKDQKELQTILPKLNQDTYNEMLPHIKNNFEKAQEYNLTEDWIYKNLKFIFD